MRLIDQVMDFLEAGNWKYDVVESDDGIPAVNLSFKGKNGSWRVCLHTDEDKSFTRIHSIFPIEIPKKRRRAVAEFITRANFGLVLGGFEMDFSDGQLMFKTSIDVEGGELVPSMVDNLLRANLISMDRYFPGIMRVVYSDESPKYIYRDIQNALEKDEDEDELSQEM